MLYRGPHRSSIRLLIAWMDNHPRLPSFRFRKAGRIHIQSSSALRGKLSGAGILHGPERVVLGPGQGGGIRILSPTVQEQTEGQAAGAKTLGACIFNTGAAQRGGWG